MIRGYSLLRGSRAFSQPPAPNTFSLLPLSFIFWGQRSTQTATTSSQEDQRGFPLFHALTTIFF